MNDYSNEDNRQSVAVLVIKCNKDKNRNCKDDRQIEELLQKIYFTTYLVHDTIQFSGSDKTKLSKPFRTRENFHS